MHVGGLKPTNAVCEFAKSHYRFTFKIMWSTNVPSPASNTMFVMLAHRRHRGAGTLKSSMAQDLVKNADSVWRQGGAVYIRNGASATFTSCPFTSNTADVGAPLSDATAVL